MRRKEPVRLRRGGFFRGCSATLAGLRKLTACDDHSDELFRLIAAGMSMREACASDPRFPTFPAFQTRVQKDPAFRSKYLAVKESWKLNQSPARRAALKYFDAIMAKIEAGATILDALKSDPAFPSFNTFATVLKLRPELDRRYREASRKRQEGPNALARGANYTADEIRKAVAAVPLVRKRSGHAKVYAGGPHTATLRYRADRDSHVANQLRSAFEKRNLAAAGERNVERSQGSLSIPLQQSLKQNEAYRIALAAMPRGLNPDAKDDVVQSIMLAVAEKSLTVGRIRSEARRFIDLHFRNFGDREFESLDRTEWIGGAQRTLVDSLTSDDLAMHI